MKWTLLGESAAAVRLFNLVDNNNVKAILRYHRTQQSVRISSRNRQRVYFIEQGGFRNNHYTFKNEYGFETGTVHMDNTPGFNGFLETDKTKIQYAFQQHYNALPEIILYEADGLKPKVICGLQQSFINKPATTPFDTEHACLLWGLYWSMQTDHTPQSILTDGGMALAAYPSS